MLKTAVSGRILAKDARVSLDVSCLGFCILDLFRISCFGFRISWGGGMFISPKSFAALRLRLWSPQK
jgi:hypothetical protein